MDKELKKKMLNIQKKMVKELGEESDALITSFNDGQCGCIMHGAAHNIAHSIFALIHDKQNDMGNELYRVIKLVTLNIINNESPYAMDLLTSILNTPAPIYKKPNDEQAVVIKMPLKNEKE